MSDIILNEDERDCLQELMNVAYGSATAAISDILSAFATLSIPEIQIIDVLDLKYYLSKEEDKGLTQFVSTQQFNGEIAGENLFIINNDCAKNMALQFGLEEDEINDDELSDIILEITNILSSSTISTLSENMDIPITFSPPGIKILTSINDFDNNFINNYEKVIIISTQLNFEDQNISGELLILTTDESIILIKDQINKMLNEL